MQNLNRKRQRSSATPDVDAEKVIFFARSLNVENFKVSDGWLGRWKTHVYMVFRKAQGEKRCKYPYCRDVAGKNIKNILRRYNESDIFNIDESGL